MSRLPCPGVGEGTVVPSERRTCGGGRTGSRGGLRVRRSRGPTAVAEVFGQRVARDDIAFDQEDDRLGFRQGIYSFCRFLTAMSARLAMAFHWAEESAEFSREMGIEAISAFNVAGGVKFLGGG